MKVHALLQNIKIDCKFFIKYFMVQKILEVDIGDYSMRKIIIPLCVVSLTHNMLNISLMATAESNRQVAGAFTKAGESIKSGAEKAGAGIKSAGETVYEKGLKPVGQSIATGVVSAAGQTKQGFEQAGDQIKKGFETATGKVKDMANKAADVFKDMGNKTQDFFENKIYNKGLKVAYQKGIEEGAWVKDQAINKVIIPAAGEVLLFSKISAQMFRNWFGKKIKPDFCKDFTPQLHNLPTVDDPAVKKEDTEGLIPYIIKYAPISYLQSDEIYFPIWITEWCNGPQTSIKTPGGQTIVPAGQVTMEAAYELYRESMLPQLRDEKTKLEAEKAKKPADARLNEINNRLTFINRVIDWKYSGKPALNTGSKTPGEPGTIKYDEIYFDNPTCANYGSNPDNNKNAQGNLTTPVYVATSEEDGNIYIYYLYFYGFNAPYDIGPITGDTFDIQDAHEADLEHVTLELDKNTKALKRIFFAAHGTTEGFWLPANHPDISWENGHPVTFSARGSHADYPRAVTYIRIYGIANDITDKGTRWTPKLVRIYPPEDPRFDPKTMGWVCFPGTMGRRGVGHPTGQGWFMKNKAGNIGRDYNSAPICDNPSWGGGDPISKTANEIVAEAKYAECIASKLANAKPPF